MSSHLLHVIFHKQLSLIHMYIYKLLLCIPYSSVCTFNISRPLRYAMTVTVFKEVTSDCVKLSNGEDLPCGLVVWSTGLSPTQFVKSLGVDKNRNGQVHVQELYNSYT